MNDGPPNTLFVGSILAGVLVLVLIVGYAQQHGGLPGIQNSPSATIDGNSTVGRSAAD